MTFGAKVLRFYKNLQSPKLPPGIAVMNPYKDAGARHLSELFLKKFFSDSKKRILVLGINPGRFGGGLTGVNFTDPVALEQFCGIPNDLPKKRETSSEFVYKFIESWGGAEKFYSQFFLSAVCPLGFTRKNNNYNYYDDRALQEVVTPYIVTTLRQQIKLGVNTDAAIVFGTGKNYEFLKNLNKEHHFFKTLYPLEHPRFIMQYKRRQLPAYLKKYRAAFTQALAV
jgi:hypothetical protein